MRFECWVNKDYKQSEYLIITAFHGEKLLIQMQLNINVYSTLPVLISATLHRTALCLGNITTAITAPWFKALSF